MAAGSSIAATSLNSQYASQSRLRQNFARQSSQMRVESRFRRKTATKSAARLVPLPALCAGLTLSPHDAKDLLSDLQGISAFSHSIAA